MTRIEGQSLLGFGDYFSDEVGAAKIARPTSTKKITKPAGKLVKGTIAVRKTKSKGKPSPHKAALTSAALAGKNAVTIAKKVAAGTEAYRQNVAAGKHAPPVRLVHVGYSGGMAVLGVAAGKSLTPKQKAAVARHANAAARLSKAHKTALAAAAVAAKKGQAALAFVKQTLPIVKKALVVKPLAGGKAVVGVARMVHALGGVDALSDEEVLGLSVLLGDIAQQSGAPAIPGYLPGANASNPYAPSAPQYSGAAGTGYAYSGYGAPSTDGSVPGDANGLMPGQPGYDPTSDPSSPQYAGGAPGADTSGVSAAGVVTAPDGTVLYDPSQDPGVIPPPVRGQTLTQDELMEVWNNVPDDGFVYGVSEGGAHYPQNSVGSVNVFTGSNKNANGWAPGLIFGGEDWMGPSPSDPNTFEHGTWDSTAQVQNRSLQLGWGPLVGNPQGQLANLQYAVADKKWFWQGKSAPLSYSAEADSKIAQANQQTIAANTAAAVAQLKQMQADQAQQAEAQANQDAQNALAESAATSAANVAQTQQDTQSSQLDLDTQKEQLAEQAQQAQVQQAAQAALIQQSQQQAGVQAQAQQALLDQASTYNEYLKTHPEELAASMADEGAPDGGDQGAGDDDQGGDREDGGDEGSDDDLLSEDDGSNTVSSDESPDDEGGVSDY